MSVNRELVKPDNCHLFGDLHFLRASAAGQRQVTDNLSLLAVTIASGRFFALSNASHGLLRFSLDQAAVPAVFDQCFIIKGNAVIWPSAALYPASRSLVIDRCEDIVRWAIRRETRIDQVFGSLIGALEIIGDHFMGFHFRFGDPVRKRRSAGPCRVAYSGGTGPWFPLKEVRPAARLRTGWRGIAYWRLRVRRIHGSGR